MQTGSKFVYIKFATFVWEFVENVAKKFVRISFLQFGINLSNVFNLSVKLVNVTNLPDKFDANNFAACLHNALQSLLLEATGSV